MRKKFSAALFAGLMTLSLAACGGGPGEPASSAGSIHEEQKPQSAINSQGPELSAQSDAGAESREDFTAQLKPFYGTYRFEGNSSQAKDPNEIAIDENGVTYGGKTLSILRVTMDNHVKFNDSDVMFIMQDGSISANFLHSQDNSTLEIYGAVQGQSANAEGLSSSSGETAASADEPDAAVGSKAAGAYTGQNSTLSVTADGSFTYTESSRRFEATLTGKLPDEMSQGMSVQSGEYTLQISFRDDYSAFMIEVKDASGKTIGGDDLSRN